MEQRYIDIIILIDVECGGEDVGGRIWEYHLEFGNKTIRRTYYTNDNSISIPSACIPGI